MQSPVRDVHNAAAPLKDRCGVLEDVARAAAVDVHALHASSRDLYVRTDQVEAVARRLVAELAENVRLEAEALKDDMSVRFTAQVAENQRLLGEIDDLRVENRALERRANSVEKRCELLERETGAGMRREYVSGKGL